MVEVGAQLLAAGHRDDAEPATAERCGRRPLDAPVDGEVVEHGAGDAAPVSNRAERLTVSAADEIAVRLLRRHPVMVWGRSCDAIA